MIKVLLLVVSLLSSYAHAGNIPLVYQLFGPAQGAGVYSAAYGQPCCGHWQFATGVSSTSKTFMFGSFGGMRKFHWVRALAVWVPGSPSNCMRFVYWYAAPGQYDGVIHHLKQMCGYELPSQGYGLVPQGVDLTAEVNAFIDSKTDVYIGYQTWDDGSPFQIWEVRLEMFQKDD